MVPNKLPINRQTYDILRRGDWARVFSIDKNNNFVFKKGEFKGMSPIELFKEYGSDFLEYLDNLYNHEDINMIDKLNIIIVNREIRQQTHATQLRFSRRP